MGAIQRKAMLVISRRRIFSEQISDRVVIHHEAKEITRCGYLFYIRRGHAIKVNASAEATYQAGSLDINHRFGSY